MELEGSEDSRLQGCQVFRRVQHKRTIQDIVTQETRNGRAKIIDNPDTIEDTPTTHIGLNESNPIEDPSSNDDEVDEEAIEEIDEQSNIEDPQRKPGRPKGSTNRIITPSRQYNLRSNNKRPMLASTVDDSPSNGNNVELHESMYAFLASEVVFSQAIAGPDATEWKNAIYNEMKSLVANDT